MAIVGGCMLNERTRSTLSIVISIVNWACILTAIGLVGVGAFIKLSIQQYTRLVENYDGDTLPYFLIALGLTTAVVNGSGGFVCFMIADPSKRRFFKPFLLGFLIVAICLCVCDIAAGILCFTHIQHLETSFHGGLQRAMSEYVEIPHIKDELDMLQMEFRCCGSQGYTDWFKVPISADDYLHPSKLQELSQNNFIHDDVPFSCCNPKSRRPCIHDDVHDNARHYNYDYTQGVTVHTKGCTDSLMDYFGDTILINIGGFIMAVFLLQVIIVILLRYLQTSMFGALELNSPDEASRGYLCMCGGNDPAATSKHSLGSMKYQVPTNPGPMSDACHSDSFDSFDESASLIKQHKPSPQRSSKKRHSRASTMSRQSAQVHRPTQSGSVIRQANGSYASMHHPTSGHSMAKYCIPPPPGPPPRMY